MQDQPTNDGLTEEEQRKARRAEINRQNAQKSTGPKTSAGKMNSRLNSFKNGSRTLIVDNTGGPGLALLSGEDPTEYRNMVAEYSRGLAPRDRVEMGIVQRVVDAQWRSLRNSRLQTLELEGCLSEVREIEHPGMSAQMEGDIDLISATRMALNSKFPQQLERQAAGLLRIISASLRELNMYRKLNPLPQPPVRPRTEYLGPDVGPLGQNEIDRQAEANEKNQENAPPATERSQVETAWAPIGERPAKPPTKPMTRAAGSSMEGNAFSDQPEPPY